MAGKVDSSEFQGNRINTQICAFLNLCAKKGCPVQGSLSACQKLVFEPVGRTLSHLGGSITGYAFRLIAALCLLSPFCLRWGPFHRGKGPKARRAAARTPGGPGGGTGQSPGKALGCCAALHPLPRPAALGRAHARNAPGRAWRQKPPKTCIMPPDGAQKEKPRRFPGAWVLL